MEVSICRRKVENERPDDASVSPSSFVRISVPMFWLAPVVKSDILEFLSKLYRAIGKSVVWLERPHESSRKST